MLTCSRRTPNEKKCTTPISVCIPQRNYTLDTNLYN